MSNGNEFTETTVLNLVRKLSRRLAEVYGGNTTLHEVMVLSKLFVCHHEGETSTVTGLAIELGMSKPTVSRILTSLRERKLVCEYFDDCDRRRRLVEMTEAHVESMDEDVCALLRWLNQDRYYTKLKTDTQRLLSDSIRQKLAFD